MADFNFVESMVGVPDLLLTHLPNMYGLDNYHYNHSHTAHQQWRIGHVGHAARKEKFDQSGLAVYRLFTGNPFFDFEVGSFDANDQFLGPKTVAGEQQDA